MLIYKSSIKLEFILYVIFIIDQLIIKQTY